MDTTVLPKDSEYLCVPLQVIELEKPLPYSLFLKIHDRYVRFRSVQDSLTEARLKTLREQSVNAVHVLKTEWQTFLGSFDEVYDSEIKKTDELSEALLVKTGNYVNVLWKDLEQKKLISQDRLDRIQDIAYRLSKTIIKNPALASKIIRRSTDSSLYYTNHTINVMVYSIIIGVQQKLPFEKLKVLSFGALLHNLGNILVPIQILHKDGPLTDEEKKIVESHTSQGEELLKKLDVPKEVVTILVQHHERVDGGGYPKGLKNNEIHLFAKICSIADCFDALISVRPHNNKPLDPQSAIKTMAGFAGKFDPTILKFMGAKG
jgi:HD-GYP domain-containing protein (c-di-GMP phosphodiesterase class II)